MSKAKERALEAYPEKLVTYSDLFGEETLDDNVFNRILYVKGYEQAIGDICEWLSKRAKNYVGWEYNEFHHEVEHDGSYETDRLIEDLQDEFA